VIQQEKLFFTEKGFLVIEPFLKQEEVQYYSNIYNDFLNNKFDVLELRSDLSGANNQSMEFITQIMLPSKVYPNLLAQPMHKKAAGIAKFLMGDDMVLDFDMLINKPPMTNKETPWHQDAAYWIDLPDKRALSFWFAIDKATLNNGCMWYTPKSHLQPLKKHFQPLGGGPIQCKGTEHDSIAAPLKPGSCVIHQGQTLHYSRGNTTSQDRRAIILNFRPKKMVELERAQGFDHSGKRKVRTEDLPSQKRINPRTY
jgi:phytanoyl-CoA hydroxylase|tara:strand:+ start:1208 stop:1972 length:765 start_codon:yes stop_codon:yes gene_type:complete